VISTELILYAFVAYVVAGTIKGTVGIGLPVAAIGILSQFTDPRMAISLVVFPIIFSNAWQIFREGHVVETIKSYWLFALALMLVLGSTTFVTAGIDTDTLFLILGTVIFLFAITSLMFTPPTLPDRYDRVAQLLVGSLSGVLGGLTAIWAPPIIMYLIARRVDKKDFVRVMGVLLFLGSIPLCIGFWQTGLLTGATALFSIGMIVPTLLGFSLGEILRRRLNSQRFRTLVLLVFLVVGLNLIRKSIS
jgi:uncharacterized membrane protein YfcA